MNERFLLCRPEGGLVNMLVQIEKCCRYAEEFGRTVVVQSDAPQSVHFRDCFDRYFRSTQRRLVLDASPHLERFRTMALLPAHLAGRLDGYRIDHARGLGTVDQERRLPVTFDFARDHAAPLLLHHQGGGGRIALFLLLRMTLRPALAAELARRMGEIGRPYTAIHVRHTDRRTDYRPALAALERSRARRIFLATDDAAVRADFHARLGEGRVVSFAALDVAPGTPIHTRRLSGADAFACNRDAILDLLMLALSDRLVTMRLSGEADGGAVSGFSQLALDLWRAKAVLNHVLAGSGLRVGLDA